MRNDEVSKRRKKRKRLLMLLLTAGVIVGSGIAGTHAFSGHEASRTNLLTGSATEIAVTEVTEKNLEVRPGTTQQKEVKFTNTGESAVFLRVAYIDTWNKGSEWLQGSSSQVIHNWGTNWGADWEKKDDGWYYYKEVLPSGGVTHNFLESVTFPADMGDDYKAATYDLVFTAEAIQCSAMDEVNDDAVKELFPGRTATIESKLLHPNGSVASGKVTWQ